MAVHLMFIFGLFIEKEGVSASIPEVLAIFESMWIAVVALLISHGFSFKQNFIDKQEYLRLTIRDQMHKPYSLKCGTKTFSNQGGQRSGASPSARLKVLQCCVAFFKKCLPGSGLRRAFPGVYFTG